MSKKRKSKGLPEKGGWVQGTAQDILANLTGICTCTISYLQRNVKDGVKIYHIRRKPNSECKVHNPQGTQN